MDYNFAQKNHWRNRVWNELAERVTVHPRDAIVLYLASEQDMDRPTAIRKGFNQHNLIAVDRDAKAVERIRATGALAVHGDIFDVINSWPEAPAISAVIADLTCGAHFRLVVDMGLSQNLRQTNGSVWVINMMRGRDASSNYNRTSVLRDCACLCEAAQVSPLHRGIYAWDWYCNTSFRKETGLLRRNLTPLQMENIYGPFIRKTIRICNVCVDSYKSTCGVMFDWVVFNSRTWDHDPLKDNWTSFRDKNEQLSRSISAVLAHRTRRLAA